jgi:hypothetical protein
MLKVREEVWDLEEIFHDRLKNFYLNWWVGRGLEGFSLGQSQEHCDVLDEGTGRQEKTEWNMKTLG